jgi:hypothetical protein
VRDLFVNRKKRLLSALCAGALAAGLMLADYVLGVLRPETAYPDQRQIQYSFGLPCVSPFGKGG